MPYLNVHGCDLYYAEWGEPDGKPVVLVHAFGLSGHMWSQQLPDLVEAGLRCITFDRRGHGRSDVARSGYDLDTLADDLGAVVERLGVQDAVLVGHSMGANEVVRYLTRHGTGRVAGIVLSAPSLPVLLQSPANPDGIPPAVVEEVRAVMRTDVGAWMARTSNEQYFGPSWPMADGLGTWTRQQIAATPLPVLLACQRSFVESDLRPELTTIRVPALVLHGDADTTCPLDRTGQPTAALLPEGRLVVIKGAGHGLYASAVRPYNAALLELVARCGTALADAGKEPERAL